MQLHAFRGPCATQFYKWKHGFKPHEDNQSVVDNSAHDLFLPIVQLSLGIFPPGFHYGDQLKQSARNVAPLLVCFKSRHSFPHPVVLCPLSFNAQKISRWHRSLAPHLNSLTWRTTLVLERTCGGSSQVEYFLGWNMLSGNLFRSMRTYFRQVSRGWEKRISHRVKNFGERVESNVSLNKYFVRVIFLLCSPKKRTPENYVLRNDKVSWSDNCKQSTIKFHLRQVTKEG